jgi:outer membrane protein, heavy metal efflux system
LNTAKLKSFIVTFLLFTCLPASATGQSTPVEQKIGGVITTAQPEFKIPEGVNPTDGLSEDEAVAVALWNNPQLHADLTALGLARADLKDAGLLRNPLLMLLLPVSPFPQFESAIQFPADVFWQRRKRVEAAKAEFERVAVSLDQNALNLIRDVRLAFADLELARQRTEMTAETLRLRKEILRLMEIRLREGDVSEAEVAAATLDESLAEEQATRFEREMTIVRNRLR